MKLICDVHYLNGNLAGCHGCRWAVVVGHDIKSPFALDCYGFPAKPTNRQLRKLKKIYSNK